MRAISCTSGACLLLLGAACVRAQVATSPAAPSLADITAFDGRAAQLGDEDIEGRMALARWARDHELWPQAIEMAKQVLYREPGNRAAYQILQQVDEAVPLPAEPAAERQLQEEFAKRFNHDFKTRSTRHFLLCYDTTDAFAVQRGVAMEHVYDAFQFYFIMQTLHPRFLQRRLVVILFKSRDDFLAYARQTTESDMSWSAGFYSQISNRSTFFDDSSAPSVASLNQQSAELKARIESLTRDIDAAGGNSTIPAVNRAMVERYRAGQALSQLNLRLGNTILMRNNTKTLHEAAHHIAFNTGIQKRLVDYPMWFSEGLACSFEVEDSAGRRGPAILNFGRIAELKAAQKAGKLVPLDVFVTQDRPEKIDESSAGVIYAQGWALFHYLYKFNRAGMEKYLLSYLARPRLRQATAEERKQLFTAAFGDNLEELDKKFTAYIKSLPLRAQ
jgi:hypothetical protein